MGKFDDLRTKKKSVDTFIDGADKYQNKASGEDKEPQERLNVEIPKTLHKKVKLKAVEEEIKIRELVIMALNDYLKK